MTYVIYTDGRGLYHNLVKNSQADVSYHIGKQYISIRFEPIKSVCHKIAIKIEFFRLSQI